MSLRERVYSVLLVSAADSFNAAFTALLPETAYQPVYTVNSISAAKRVLAERSFDFIFVNSPLPDDAGDGNGGFLGDGLDDFHHFFGFHYYLCYSIEIS